MATLGHHRAQDGNAIVVSWRDTVMAAGNQ